MLVYPWNDYGGRFSPLKLAVFVSLFAPAEWVAVAYYFDLLGARPLNEAIHQIGLWTIRLIFLALAITPLRQILITTDPADATHDHRAAHDRCRGFRLRDHSCQPLRGGPRFRPRKGRK